MTALALKPVKWSPRAEFFLAPSLGDCRYKMAALRELIERGRAVLYRFREGRRTVGFAAVAPINDMDGRDLFVIAVGGRAKADLTAFMVVAFKKIAAAAGLSGVRCQTARAGLARKLIRAGFTQSAVVLRAVA